MKADTADGPISVTWEIANAFAHMEHGAPPQMALRIQCPSLASPVTAHMLASMILAALGHGVTRGN